MVKGGGAAAVWRGAWADADTGVIVSKVAAPKAARVSYRADETISFDWTGRVSHMLAALT